MLTKAEIVLILTPIAGAALAAATSHFTMRGVWKRRAMQDVAWKAKVVAGATEAASGEAECAAANAMNSLKLP